MNPRLALPAHLTNLALQCGAPLEQVGDLLAGAKFEPCGPVSGHDRVKYCSSLPDLSGRHELGHVAVVERADDTLSDGVQTACGAISIRSNTSR